MDNLKQENTQLKAEVYDLSKSLELTNQHIQQVLAGIAQAAGIVVTEEEGTTLREVLDTVDKHRAFYEENYVPAVVEEDGESVEE